MYVFNGYIDAVQINENEREIFFYFSDIQENEGVLC